MEGPSATDGGRECVTCLESFRLDDMCGSQCATCRVRRHLDDGDLASAALVAEDFGIDLDQFDFERQIKRDFDELFVRQQPDVRPVIDRDFAYISDVSGGRFAYQDVVRPSSMMPAARV
jgi:hypothetical protein